MGGIFFSGGVIGGGFSEISGTASRVVECGAGGVSGGEEKLSVLGTRE